MLSTVPCHTTPGATAALQVMGDHIEIEGFSNDINATNIEICCISTDVPPKVIGPAPKLPNSNGGSAAFVCAPVLLLSAQLSTTKRAMCPSSLCNLIDTRTFSARLGRLGVPSITYSPTFPYNQVGTSRVASASEMLYSFGVMQQLDLDGHLLLTQDVALLVGRGEGEDGGVVAGGQGPLPSP